MPGRTKSSITITSGAGPYHKGDTVTFAITGTGVIRAQGYQGDVVRISWALTRGETDLVIDSSLAWDASPGPLHVEVQLRELVGGNVKTVAETQFEVAA